MSELLVTKIIFAVAGLCLAALGVLLLTTNERNLAGREKFARFRWSAIFPGIPALLWCVPHAQAVAPNFLLVFLYPLAIIIPILSYFVLDYITARVISGLAIIAAYEVIHRAFNAQMAWSELLVVYSWLLGFFGIWCSGIPCHFRDIFRLAARKKVFRLIFGGFFLLGAILLLGSIIHG